MLVDGVSVGAVTSYTFTNVTADHTISATFAIDIFTITPSAGPHGSISPSTPQTVTYGADRAFTITPATGYHVADVLVDGVSVGAVTGYTFTNVTADHTISATFAVDAFTITPSAGLHGSISPATPQTVEYGGSQAFSITAAAGYYVADVLVDGESVGATHELQLRERRRGPHHQRHVRSRGADGALDQHREDRRHLRGRHATAG